MLTRSFEYDEKVVWFSFLFQHGVFYPVAGIGATVTMIQRSEDKTVLVARDIHEIRHWTLIDLPVYVALSN